MDRAMSCFNFCKLLSLFLYVVPIISRVLSFTFDDLGKYFSALSNEANLRYKDFAW